MPRPSARISGIVPSGKDGWEVHFAAWKRKEAGEPIIMLMSVRASATTFAIPKSHTLTRSVGTPSSSTTLWIRMFSGFRSR